MTEGICELCLRKGVGTTVHHLTPKEEGGRDLPTADLCTPCHKQIHALFTNKELADGLNTLAALQQDERMARYLRWIRKQPPTAIPRTKKSNAVKRK